VVPLEGAKTPSLFHREFDAEIRIVEKPFIFKEL